MDIRTEIWAGHKIRFVWHNGEWWAVAKDVSDALNFRDAYNMVRTIEEKDKDTHKVSTPGGTQELLVISEFGIYDAVFNSHKPEAKDFKRWVYGILKELRQATGLEGFQIFRMLDKEHQKEAMQKLKAGLHNPVRVDFIKANTIANKAVSNKYGFPKLVKKGDMTPDMLVDRQSTLEDTVELMAIKEKYNLGISVSDRIYELHN